MKKLVYLMFSFLMISATTLNAQSVFGFKGRVMIGYDKAENVTVNLYDGNQKISSYQTSRNGKFIIDGERNKHYTLELKKEGYLTKRIVINTNVSEEDSWGVKEFKFDVSLIEKEEGIDYSQLDFPIAIIEFENIKREFSYNKEYTNNMLELQEQVLAKSTTVASN